MTTKFQIEYSDAPIPNPIETNLDFRVGDLVKHYNGHRHIDARVTEVEWVLDDCGGESYRLVSLAER